MKDQDKKEFQEKMNDMASIYGVQVTNEMLRAYFNFLSNFELTGVLSAFDSHVLDQDRGKFMPKPCDISYQIKKKNSKPEWMRGIL